MEQVQIPHDYFYKMSKKDYSYMHEALVREFFQNSRDAGATDFDLEFFEAVDLMPLENYAVTSFSNIKVTEEKRSYYLKVTDNGSGMDEDIIRNKLLVLGESGKVEQFGAVGVMGHAKLLLYFSWEEWEIRTGNLIVKGKGHYYSVEKGDEWVDGVVSQIRFPDKDTCDSVRWAVRDYFRYCDTGVSVRMKESASGEWFKISQTLRTTTLVEDENEAYDVYDSTHKSFYIVVRQNGVMMFKTWMGSTEKPTPVLEVKISALEAFLQNRDYFKRPHNNMFGQLVSTFQTDSMETYKKNADKYGIKEVTITNRVHGKEISARALLVNDMVEKKHENFLKTKRSQRLINIVEGFYDIFSSKVLALPAFKAISFGVTFDDESRGYATTEGEQIRVMLNLRDITKRSTNHRHMAINIYNLMVHELGHVLSIVKNQPVQHDEEFCRNMAQLYDKAWDQLDFITAFKQIWDLGTLVIDRGEDA